MIFTWSGSRRCVVNRDCPGLRRSSQCGISGGTPSTTTPMAGPWLSPQVVKRKSVPKLLPAKRASLDDGDVGRVHCFHADNVVAAIDVMHLAADARGEIAQQIEARAADV